MPEPSPETTPTRVAHDGPLNPAQVRWLIVAIVVMGILIVLGVLGVVARMFYLASTATPVPPRAVATAIVPDSRVQLPSGAAVRHIALDGDRLALHYDGPAGGGVVVVSIATGRVLSRLTLIPEPPR